MSKRRMDVDFGSLYLNVGSQGGGSGGDADELADPATVALFERHLGGGSQQPRGAFDASLWAVFDEALSSPARAEASVDVAPGARTSGGDIDGQMLGDAVQGLWVVHGADGRELRINLLDELLQDTRLRMVEGEGRLVVEFDAGSGASRVWLSQRLRALAEHLGRRLERPVRVSLASPLHARAADEPATETVDWPEEFEA